MDGETDTWTNIWIYVRQSLSVRPSAVHRPPSAVLCVGIPSRLRTVSAPDAAWEVRDCVDRMHAPWCRDGLTCRSPALAVAVAVAVAVAPTFPSLDRSIATRPRRCCRVQRCGARVPRSTGCSVSSPTSANTNGSPLRPCVSPSHLPRPLLPDFLLPSAFPYVYSLSTCVVCAAFALHWPRLCPPIFPSIRLSARSFMVRIAQTRQRCSTSSTTTPRTSPSARV